MPSTAAAPLPPRPLTGQHPGAAGTGPSGPAGRRPADRRTGGPPSPATPPRRRGALAVATAFAVLYAEVEAGRRERRQLRPLVSPLLYERLAPVWVRGGAPAQVVAVRGWLSAADHRPARPGEGDRWDGVAILRRGGRSGALAIRLVRSGGVWRVEEAVRPEDGPLPDLPFGFPDDRHDEGADADGLVPLQV